MADLERYEPTSGGRIAYEHLHRYAICREYVEGAKVLDVACGEGYGVAMLAAVASHVTGLDLDTKIIEIARDRYAEDNIEFLQGDAMEMPFPVASFDVIVSFETIEHLQNPEIFIKNTKKLLKPGGLLIISTPNPKIYNLSLSEPNSYHVKELEKDELVGILSKNFNEFDIYGQRMAIVSNIGPLPPFTKIDNSFTYAGYTGVLATPARKAGAQPGVTRTIEPEYFLCFCSDIGITHPHYSDSIFLNAEEDLWQKHNEVMRWASNLHEEDEKLRADLTRVQAENTELKVQESNFLRRPDYLEDKTNDDFMINQASSLLRLSGKAGNILYQQMQQLSTDLIVAQARAFPSKGQRRQELIEDLSVLNPLIRHLHGESIVTDVETLVRVLSEAWHRSEVAKIQIANLEERLDQQEVLKESIKVLELKEAALQADLVSLSVVNEKIISNNNQLQDEMAGKYTHDLEEINKNFESQKQQWQFVEQDLKGQLAAATTAAQAVEQELRTELAAAIVAAQAVEEELRTELGNLRMEKAALEAIRLQEQAALLQVEEDRHAHSIIQLALVSSVEDEKRFAELRHSLLREFVDAARAVQGWTLRRDRESVPSLLDLAAGSVVCEALFFDETFYLRQIAGRQAFLGQTADLDVIEPTGLAHYLSAGWLQGLSPSPLFDNDWYLVRHRAVVPPDMNPLTHYVRYGAAEGLQPHPCFDRHYYLRHYPEAARHQPDVYQHFVRQGLFQGCFPSAAVAEAAREGQTALDVLSALLEERLGDSDASSEAAGISWPPRPMDDYWLPQALRDYVLDTFGNEPVATLSYLMSVITQYEAAPEVFGTSHAATVLAARIRERAAAQVRRQSDAPLAASIIIPVHNNCLYTLTCLASIFEYAGERSFEIIVGDDSSTDETFALIEALEGNVRIVRHTPNKGFLGNCNACAATARGDVLVFLNNDTIVLPEWLDALIEPLDQSDIGLSGSKLINGDGTLQEAGGILWRDGSAWNFGRGDDPRLPAYSYRKDVDYCSGASIAISADLWKRLDGFDTEFTPAYCEDSDLALRVRAAGLRTILEPFSLVIHHEGRSHGRSLDMGLKAFQIVNQAKLFSRWQGTFADENLPNAQDVFLARDRSRSKPHILVVDHYIPQWDHDAGSRTMFHFIRVFLAAGFHVTFWPDNLFRTPDYARRLQQIGVEVIYGAQYVNGFVNWYSQVADHLPYVLLSRPHVAPTYIDVFDRTKTMVLYYGHDLHWKRLEAEYRVTGQPGVLVEMNKFKAQEIALCEAADVALYPSADEVAVLREEASGAIEAIAVPAWYFDPAELDRLDHALSKGIAREGRHILFVGGFQHMPNVDGMHWFMDHVWPLVTGRNPAVRITIAGSNPPDVIRRYAWMSPYITVTGFVSDEALDRLYAEASVAIVPLRFGGGVKGKLIEAFSKGIPVVSTATGVQGISNGERIAWVAEKAEAFAEHVLACLEGGEPITQKVRAAAEFLGENYSAQALVGRLRPYMPELRDDAAWARRPLASRTTPPCAPVQRQPEARIAKRGRAPIRTIGADTPIPPFDRPATPENPPVE